MKKGLIKWMAALTIMVLVAGCSGDKYKPVAINEETDRCEICNMAIKDDQYATQILTKGGQAIKFDDLGDLNAWREKNGTGNIGATFVRDFNSMRWIKYEDAYYVYDASIPTPMAYGVISFETEKAAQEYVEQHGVGVVFSAEQLANHTWEVNHDMMDGHHGHGHEHGDDHGHEQEGHDEEADDNHGHGEAHGEAEQHQDEHGH